MPKVAIIGAGLSGLVIARRLQGTADVRLFEKSRGAGGRMATRYAGEFEFDHGTQFFTARTKEFQAFLSPLIDAGIVADWNGPFAEFEHSSLKSIRSWDEHYPHYVGTPRMNRIGKELSTGLDIRFETTISDIRRDASGWMLVDDSGASYGHFDWLVITAPAAQTANLGAKNEALVTFCEDRRMLGCYALMIGFAVPLELPWQAALVRNADISWISVNSSKPGRNAPFTILVHSTNAWAEAHMDDDIADVEAHMLAEASTITGMDLNAAVHRQVHRWRFANIAKQSGPSYFLSTSDRLAACGDWCVRGRIEAAFTSANALAATLFDGF